MGAGELVWKRSSVIDKRDLIEAATALGLTPHVVEKDYALGWVLAGIFSHPELTDSWVFKGGTCLKKCFFETYRFSEDLDFTLKDAGHLDEAFLKRVFGEIAEWIYEECGLELPAELRDFDIYTNPRGHTSCQGKLSYRGPLAPRSGGLPRIKLDLTADEKLVLAPVRLRIFHPYGDEPGGGIEVLTYAYEEAFGEKVRALGERTRPRDLYDVINLYRNEEARPSASVLLDVLRQKCAFKGIEVPAMAALEPHRPDLEGSWEAMLRHQLPALPPLASFWNELPNFFAWLLGGAAPARPAAYAMAAGESVLRERTLALPIARTGLPHIEVIRFAAANRLCVDLSYVTLDGRSGTRRIEPYSLRRTAAGDIILHAFNTDKNQHRSYRVDRITDAAITNQTFIPRYEIELSPQGPVSIRPAASRSGGAALSRLATPRTQRAAAPRRMRAPRSTGGPTYIFQCPVCDKKFRRKKYDSTLNPHKGKDGFPCYGRIGTLIDTQY